MGLEEKKWKEFLFPEIFEIKKGYYNKKPIPSGKGKIPFLSATQFNNGVSEFYTISEIENASKTGDDKNNHPIEDKIFKGNCIAVTNNGSVGFAFYQKSDFTCSHDINPLYLKDYELNPFIAKFLIATIEKQRVCFEYARKWRPIRMVKSKILLPVNPKDEPNYEFMEAFIKERQNKQVLSYTKYIENRILAVSDFKEVCMLNDKRFSEFEIEKVFNVNSGTRLTKADMKPGNKPFIGATDSNNGITEYVSNTNDSEDSNVLGVNYNGSVVENFYHPYKAIFSDDVKRLSFKERKGNRHLFLFVKTQILQQKVKYQYGYKFNGTRMNRQKIMLPVNERNEPDYDYMENYMKQLEYKKLNEYLNIKSELN